MRFDHTVPVKTIELPTLEINGLSSDQYEIIDVKKTYRLSQRPASYVVLCYEQPVVKIKESKQIVSAIMTMNVLEKSLAGVSFLVGLLFGLLSTLDLTGYPNTILQKRGAECS